jgi:lysozyme
MQTSPNGRKFIESNEGCRLTAYQDTKGIWTNGVGNTHDVVPGSTITQEKADADLESNLGQVEAVMNNPEIVKVPLNQNQYDALADFVFNVGIGAFENSTLLKLLNQSDFLGSANQFLAWVKQPELTPRRNRERALFLTPETE